MVIEYSKWKNNNDLWGWKKERKKERKKEILNIMCPAIFTLVLRFFKDLNAHIYMLHTVCYMVQTDFCYILCCCVSEINKDNV